LSVNGKRSDITRQDLLDVAYQMNVKKAPKILDEINNIVSEWNSYAEKFSVHSDLKEAINKTLVLI